MGILSRDDTRSGLDSKPRAEAWRAWVHGVDLSILRLEGGIDTGVIARLSTDCARLDNAESFLEEPHTTHIAF
jgi:hypothetical protein